jgi:SpoVK/Ycf46/Vps4 family AAA+-type ATPase
MAFDKVYIDEDKWIVFSTLPDISNLIEIIPPGVYKVGINQFTGKQWLVPTSIVTENLIPLEDEASVETLDFINEFFTVETKERYQRYNILYRSGLLLHGSPGTGKTYVIHRVKEAAISAGYIVLIDPPPDLVSKFIENIRVVTKNPTYPILVIWEEIDSYLINYENRILELLDGRSTVENIIYIGTTNYIDKIPDRLKARPSRFNRIIEVKTPSVQMRRSFFNAKLHPEDKERWLEPMVEASDGLVLDFCKELILSILVYNKPLQAEANRLKLMAKVPVTIEEEEEEEEDSEVCPPLTSLIIGMKK